MQNIVLIGFMGSGKSTIAKLLSHTLQCSLIDSDIYIAKQAQQDIRDIFAQKGEKHFRDLEFDFIQTFSQQQNHVIATGGGMPIFNDIKGLGICVYLKTDFEVICTRLAQTTQNHRPLFDDKQNARELFLQREPIYTNISDMIIDANHNKSYVAKQILKNLKGLE